jgi:hypothetical protein
MKKIIGRGVLLLDSANEKGLKFGYELSTEGILLSPLGENASLQSLSKTLRKTHDQITGTGHIILNALPASPNDAFYDVTFVANEVGYAIENYTLIINPPGTSGNEAFAHGPQYYFSGLNLTYSYENIGNTKPSVVSLEGKIFLHLEQGVFEDWTKLEMTLDWTVESDTLIFSNADYKFPMDTIGELSKIGVELGQSYDRWAQVQGLYTFDGVAGDFATHDISGQGAPSLYFKGEENFKEGSDEPPYAATWTETGIALDGGVLASPEGIPNAVVDSILQTESFSVEMWLSPSKSNHKEKAWIFAFNGKTVGSDYPYNFYLGQGPWHTEIDQPSSFARANFRFPPLGKPAGIRSWEYPLESPANSMTEEQMHLVYSCSKDGMQRIYINGIKAVERHNPDYLNTWGGNLRMVVGSDIPKMTHGNIYEGQPWKGEIHHLAIYNRALTEEEVNLHYLPVVKITGDMSLDNMIAPLTDEVYPFHLTTSEDTAALVASREVEFNIKPQLGFRKIEIDCSKLKDAPWAFSGKFQTIFWEDFFELNAHLEESNGNLELTSSPDETQPINISGIGVAKYNDILLKIGNENNWELSFGEHQEHGLISMVLENHVSDYGGIRIGRPHLHLSDPIVLNGNWLGEEMIFTSEEREIDGVNWGQILKGSTAFDMIFSLTIPSSVNETSGIKNGEDIELIDTIIHITLDVELQKEGFFAKLNWNFDYTAPSGEQENIKLAERRLYQSPASKNELLEEILEEIKINADNLFVELRSHQEDYYINSDAIIQFKGSDTSENGVLSVLPNNLIAADSNFPLGNDSISIVDDEEQGICLKIDVKDGVDIKIKYDDFFVDDVIVTLSDDQKHLLRQRIIERLPLNYNQVLEYYYGWNLTENYLDLQGGMRLRIDFQNYQFVQASDPTALRGYAGSGGYYINVNSYTDSVKGQLLGFGSFISRLETDNEMDLKKDGAGGVFDLLKSSNDLAYFRLVYPKQPMAGNDPERLVTFIGADSLENLESATKDLIEKINNNETIENTFDSESFYFRGKAMVVPEIQVYVSEEAVYVPVGTTIRQLVEQYDDVPRDGLNQDMSVFMGKSRPMRRIHEGADSQPEYRFINFSDLNTDTDTTANEEETDSAINVLDLPLIKGDRFYF